MADFYQLHVHPIPYRQKPTHQQAAKISTTITDSVDAMTPKDISKKLSDGHSVVLGIMDGERLKRKAKEEAPVETYFLQEQIVSRYSPLTAMVHAQASYSAYQEFGTRFMPAQPFMKPSLLWVQPKYQKDMTDVMKGVFE